MKSSTFIPLLLSLSLSQSIEIGFTTDQILSITCDYASLVSRSKRSIMEPEVENPQALFQFFYPMADVPASQAHLQSSRSGTSSWMDDIGDLWRYLCKQRQESKAKIRPQRKKRTLRKKRDDPQSTMRNIGDIVTWAGYLGNLSSSYLPNNYAESDDEDSENEDELSTEEDEDETDEDEGEEEEKAEKSAEEESKDEDEEEEDEVETTTAAAPAAAAKTEDPNFASYGGDIEYFIPLISFTIPFDGEITVLGFHGFKGMFPY